jgi:hypothetical protein
VSVGAVRGCGTPVGTVGGCGTRGAACSVERPPASRLSATPATTLHSASPRVSEASRRFSAALAGLTVGSPAIPSGSAD